jgi:hypothetical protein
MLGGLGIGFDTMELNIIATEKLHHSRFRYLHMCVRDDIIAYKHRIQPAFTFLITNRAQRH